MKKTIMAYGGAMLGAAAMVAGLLASEGPNAETFIGGPGTDSLVMADAPVQAPEQVSSRSVTTTTTEDTRYSVEPAAGAQASNPTFETRTYKTGFTQTADSIEPTGHSLTANNDGMMTHNIYVSADGGVR